MVLFPLFYALTVGRFCVSDCFVLFLYFCLQRNMINIQNRTGLQSCPEATESLRGLKNERINIFSLTFSSNQSRLFFSLFVVSHSNEIVTLIVAYIDIINTLTHCGIKEYSTFTICNDVKCTASFGTVVTLHFRSRLYIHCCVSFVYL